MPVYRNCVECGATNNGHPMAMRCIDCGRRHINERQRARSAAIKNGTHTPRKRQAGVSRDHNQIAHKLVAAAVRYGFLLPATELDCVDCGQQASYYEHRDYNRPLDVEPVCAACNNRRGPGIPMRLPSSGKAKA